MRGIARFAIASVLLFAGAGARAEDAGGEPAHERLFHMYCAGCHGLNGAPGREGVPDLSGLAAKYGAPLPTARLVDFVIGDHRVGGSRICGERVFWRLPPGPFNDYAERVTVRAALEFVAAAQPHD